jgi:hypothetical protein
MVIWPANIAIKTLLLIWLVSVVVVGYQIPFRRQEFHHRKGDGDGHHNKHKLSSSTPTSYRRPLTSSSGNDDGNLSNNNDAPSLSATLSAREAAIARSLNHIDTQTDHVVAPTTTTSTIADIVNEMDASIRDDLSKLEFTSLRSPSDEPLPSSNGSNSNNDSKDGANGQQPLNITKKSEDLVFALRDHFSVVYMGTLNVGKYLRSLNGAIMEQGLQWFGLSTALYRYTWEELSYSI